MFPKLLGSFDVGVVDVIKKSFIARLFYPAASDPDFKSAFWHSDAFYLNNYSQFFKDDSKFHKVRLPSNVQFNATPIAQKFPTVIASHGLFGNRFGNSYQNACIASHGYAVLALEHRDGTANVTYNLTDKDYKNYLYYEQVPAGFSKEVFLKRQQQLETRRSEVLKACEYLKAADGVRGVDGDRKPFIVGHSFGGATAFTSYLQNPDKLETSIGLDPWTFVLSNDQITTPTDQKVLTIMSEEFMQFPKVKSKAEAFPNQELVVPAGSNHMSIGSDLSLAYQFAPDNVVPINKELGIAIKTDASAADVAQNTANSVVNFLKQF